MDAIIIEAIGTMVIVVAMFIYNLSQSKYRRESVELKKANESLVAQLNSSHLNNSELKNKLTKSEQRNNDMQKSYMELSEAVKKMIPPEPKPQVTYTVDAVKFAETLKQYPIRSNCGSRPVNKFGRPVYTSQTPTSSRASCTRYYAIPLTALEISTELNKPE